MRFVLIDRLVELEPGRRARAAAVFPASDPIFDDHFPGFPVVPGVLLTEAMGQTAGWLIAATIEFSAWPLLTTIDRARFQRFARPGEPIEIEAQLRSAHGMDFEVTATASVAGERAASARLLLHGFDAGTGNRDALAGWARRVFRDLGGDRLLADRRVQPSSR